MTSLDILKTKKREGEVSEVNLKYWHNQAPVCPYCDHKNEDWWDGGIRCEDGYRTEIGCHSCGKEYEVVVGVEVVFTTAGTFCDKHRLFLNSPLVKEYECEICKRQWYDWQLAGGKHEALRLDQYEIIEMTRREHD